MPEIGVPFVGPVSQMPWNEFPGHFGGALSKELVCKSMMGTSLLDLRISHYQPMARVEHHAHAVQEQIYFVLDGEGMLDIDGARHLVKRHDYAWIPAGAGHSISACGLSPLIFLVISGPSTDTEQAA